MKAKLLTKRVLSVLLVTVMLFSCWVFTAPMQANAAAGKYDLKFTVKDEGNGVDGTKRITTKYKTKANNGTGSETGEISGPSKDISNNSLTSETEVGTVSGVDFPSWVWFQDKCDTGKYPSLTGYLYVRKSGSSNSWSKVATVSKFHDKGWWGSNTGSGSAGTSGYPSANHLAWSSADTSLTVNTDGSNKSSNAYTAILQDQYDVEWHSQPTISYSMSSHTGCSFSTSTRKITLASTANAASNYALTVTASASGYSNLTQSVTINVFGSYYVTFYDENGTTVLKAKQTVAYGGNATAPSSPTKASTDTYDYKFNGWDTTITSIKSGAQTQNVKATYKASDVLYTIQFANASGSVITSATQSNKKYNDTITKPTTGPTKTSSADKNFAFAGWSTAGTAATAVTITSGTSKPSSLGLDKDHRTITYFPYYTDSTRSYSIPFKTADAVNNPNDDTKFSTYNKSTGYGSRPVPDAVTNIDTNLWKRTFTGEWESSVGGTKYTTANLPAITVSNPASDTYTVPTYTAQYTTTYYNYVINYKNGDNSNALTNTIHYDGTLTLPTAGTVTKAADAQYTYTFVGWKEGTEATWSETATVAECVSISDSTKPSDIGLSKSSLTKTYAPYFLATKNKYTITFNWKDASYADQSQTLSNQVYGTTPTAPTIPLTITTNDKIYTFKGWNTNGGTVASVTGNAVYTAFYTDEFRPYNITFSWVNPADVSQNHTKVDSVRYGSTPEAPDLSNLSIDGYAEDEHEYTTPLGTYTFNAWTPTISSVKGTTTYEAGYSLVKTDYTLTFYDEDGETVLAAPTYNWDSNLSAPVSPTKAATAQYTYTFAGWKVDDTETVIQPSYFTGKTMEDLGGNHSYTAKYEPHLRYYTITYLKSDGSSYKVINNVAYGTVPADMTGEDAVPALITRPSNATNHYTASWDNDINTAIEGDITFRIVDTPEAHEAYLGEATVTKEATCMETGLKEQTCSACNYVVKTEIPINSNAHTWARWEGCSEETVSGFGDDIPVVFVCQNGCENYCAATYDDETHIYKSTGDPGTYEYVIGQNPASIPTPTFNEYTEYFDDQVEPYIYGERKASLRVRPSEREDDTQAMRFSGNINANNILKDEGTTIPVSFEVNPDKIYDNSKLMSLAEIRAKNKADKTAFEDDTVIDFGFVYTQAKYIRSAKETINYDLLTLDYMGKNNPATNQDCRIYRMSVVENNKGNGTLSNNWKGLTDCYNYPTEKAGEPDQYTFNLVINVNVKNYQATYCARTYIIYKYHGDIICVYDQPELNETPIHSHDSVYNQAIKNEATGKLPETVVDYLDYKIINRTIKGEKRYVQQSFIDYDWNYKLTDFKKIEEQNT